MISVEKARHLIRKNVVSLPSKTVHFKDSLGSVLSHNVMAPINLPPFDQSAMDGYAIKYVDFKENKKIKVVGEVAAGEVFKNKVGRGEAVRIFTGAPIPQGADTVIMQERIKICEGQLFLEDPLLKNFANVREKGSQIKKGKIALTKGSKVNPGCIGYLAALGITSLDVVAKPRITVIVTGSELQKPGKVLNKGQIYESNSYAAVAALQSLGLSAQNVVSVVDSEGEIYKVIKKAAINSDLVLITGGISVGDYDFVGSSLNKLGVKNIFYKIKQKPGKPLFFGKKDETLIFGLPGNPAAVLSCFYEYVYPAIQMLKGEKDIFMKIMQLPISGNYPKKKGLSHFLKGKISGNNVRPLEGQESYILSSFAEADCLIYLPEESENIKLGQIVEVHLLPGLY